MKLRIVQDLEGNNTDPWFQLEKWEDTHWRYVAGSSKVEKLENHANTLLGINPDNRFVLVKEFDSEA